ncbi:MAG: dienelactone hydrolase family protein [Acidiferrobacterales bacterium]|nr:dienelactone hydrolase family protein [Acidiferrobacterales bacterium]
MLDAVTIEPKNPPILSVIWLHGLGADGHDFEPIVPHLNIPQSCPVRFIFPHAPIQSVTINLGMKMRAWYDILNPIVGAGLEDEKGIRHSGEQVQAMIGQELSKGMDANQVVLAGFSQGGAIALFTAIRYPARLSGVLAISTYLPLADAVESERHAANSDVPILSLHGDFDPVISPTIAEQSRDKLKQLGYNVETRNYPIPHSVSADEIADIGNWLVQRCTEL